MNPPYPNLCEHMWILEQAYMHMDEKVHLSIRFEMIFWSCKELTTIMLTKLDVFLETWSLMI